MIYKPTYFDLEELVCPHVFKKFGDVAWQFFDERLLIIMDLIREKLNKPIFVNDWNQGGKFDERGFRCIQCSLVKNAIKEKRLYISPHMTGQGADFEVKGLVASEVRLWLVKNEKILPCPIRLEGNVDWIHLDTRNAEKDRVYIFNP